ncbi:MAG: hypothetical protein J5818_05935, partial [Eggerthellaceae bacterium]|nr:hypothetical protein [Eggerthellaceae bacterium]
METNFISLAVVAIVAAVVPLVANRIPNKLVPETVLLLIAGAIVKFGVLRKDTQTTRETFRFTVLVEG